jgi:hypothetical protein
MEAADIEFQRGLKYIFAARRCERWAGDERAESQLGRLATVYRARASALMGVESAIGARSALSLGEVSDSSTCRDAGGRPRWGW